MSGPTFSHGYPFDPAQGLSLAELLALEPPEPPPDFAAFWRHRHAAARKIAPEPRLQATGRRLGRHLVHDLTYRSSDGVEIGGWLLLPERGPVRRGVVAGHGYGGREAPDDPALLGLDDAAALFPCFRGMGRSPAAGLSADPSRHVLRGIEEREQYVLGGCVDDLWLALSALLELAPSATGRVAVSGVSFSGGIAALAAPWDERIQRLVIEVPSFGHQALRLSLPCIGSGEAVRRFQQQTGFNVLATLAYYDAAMAARFLAIPALVAAARFDPAVPPPGQFAILNAVPPPWRHPFLLEAGHFDHPGKERQLREWRAAAAAFLSDL